MVGDETFHNPETGGTQQMDTQSMSGMNYAVDTPMFQDRGIRDMGFAQAV